MKFWGRWSFPKSSPPRPPWRSARRYRGDGDGSAGAPAAKLSRAWLTALACAHPLMLLSGHHSDIEHVFAHGQHAGSTPASRPDEGGS